jgi:hypothetical protein
VHFLCDWLIRNGKMERNLSGCECCPEGRPIRAKELRDEFFRKRFTQSMTPPEHNAFVYSVKDGKRHVHYGGRHHLAAGTNVQPDGHTFEYYF